LDTLEKIIEHAPYDPRYNDFVGMGVIATTEINNFLKKHINTLLEVNTNKGMNVSEEQGYQSVYDALQDPFKQLIENAGDDGGYRLKQIQKVKVGYGFDVTNMTDEPINLLDKGITDPVKVLKSIVENACSVAGLAITLSGSVMIDRDFQLEQVQMTKAGMQ
jgi:chaperonin GroEL